YHSIATQVIAISGLLILCLVSPAEAYDSGDALALILGTILTMVGFCAFLGWYARRRNDTTFCKNDSELEWLVDSKTVIFFFHKTYKFSQLKLAHSCDTFSTRMIIIY
uniref:Uncharacterized protein n=1 Tax=Labrus bergylta TaxID=56723 RepID=A0A3Q3GHN1_9LABR